MLFILLESLLSRWYDNCDLYQWRVRISLNIVSRVFVSILSYVSVTVFDILKNTNAKDSISTNYGSKDNYMLVLVYGGCLFAIEMIFVGN